MIDRRTAIVFLASLSIVVPGEPALAQGVDEIIAKIQEFSSICINGKGSDAIDRCTRLINIYTLPESQKMESNDLKLFVIYGVRGEHYYKANDAIAACKDFKTALSMHLKNPAELHKRMTNDLQKMKRGCEAAGRW